MNLEPRAVSEPRNIEYKPNPRKPVGDLLFNISVFKTTLFYEPIIQKIPQSRRIGRARHVARMVNKN